MSDEQSDKPDVEEVSVEALLPRGPRRRASQDGSEDDEFHDAAEETASQAGDHQVYEEDVKPSQQKQVNTSSEDQIGTKAWADDDEGVEAEVSDGEEEGDEQAGREEQGSQQQVHGDDDVDEEETEQRKPKPKPQPFDVPSSGAFWLHDDRFDPEEAAAAQAAASKEKALAKARSDVDDKWQHDKFFVMDDEEPESPDTGYRRGRGRGMGRGRGRGRGGRGRGAYDDGEGGHERDAFAQHDSYRDAPPRRAEPAQAQAPPGIDEDFPPLPGSSSGGGRGAGSGGRGGGRSGPLFSGPPGIAAPGGRGRGRGEGGRGERGRGRGEGGRGRGEGGRGRGEEGRGGRGRGESGRGRGGAFFEHGRSDGRSHAATSPSPADEGASSGPRRYTQMSGARGPAPPQHPHQQYGQKHGGATHESGGQQDRQLSVQAAEFKAPEVAAAAAAAAAVPEPGSGTGGALRSDASTFNPQAAPQAAAGVQGGTPDVGAMLSQLQALMPLFQSIAVQQQQAQQQPVQVQQQPMQVVQQPVDMSQWYNQAMAQAMAQGATQEQAYATVSSYAAQVQQQQQFAYMQYMAQQAMAQDGAAVNAGGVADGESNEEAPAAAAAEGGSRRYSAKGR